MEIEWVEDVDGEDVQHVARWTVGAIQVEAFAYEGMSSTYVSGWFFWKREPDGSASKYWDDAFLEDNGPDCETLDDAKEAALAGAREAVKPYARMALEYAATVDPDEWPEELQEAARKYAE